MISHRRGCGCAAFGSIGGAVSDVAGSARCFEAGTAPRDLATTHQRLVAFGAVRTGGHVHVGNSRWRRGRKARHMVLVPTIPSVVLSRLV
ncbi:MAG: hypothetical protein ABMA15_19825 [Vicinamibacterales bacterium]